VRILRFINAAKDPARYSLKPRLATALEMLRVSLAIEKDLHRISAPFLVCHGNADQVTALEGSVILHQRAQSTDKTIKIYPGMCHALAIGETQENCEIVFRDMFQWLSERT